MNIIWEQPTGAIAVTSIFDGTDPADLSLRLKERGDVPGDWATVAVNYPGPWPQTPQEFWKWENGEISVDAPKMKAALWLAIKAERERRKACGVKVGDKWFHTDDASRIQHMALNMMGAAIPANLQWKTMDGSFVTMTQSLAVQVFQAVAVLDMQAFAKAEEHRIAMEASNDPANYDFSAGWPASFEG